MQAVAHVLTFTAVMKRASLFNRLSDPTNVTVEGAHFQHVLGRSTGLNEAHQVPGQIMIDKNEIGSIVPISHAVLGWALEHELGATDLLPAEYNWADSRSEVRLKPALAFVVRRVVIDTPLERTELPAVVSVIRNEVDRFRLSSGMAHRLARGDVKGGISAGRLAREKWEPVCDILDGYAQTSASDWRPAGIDLPTIRDFESKILDRKRYGDPL
jgi:hypothetical protein